MSGPLRAASGGHALVRRARLLATAAVVAALASALVGPVLPPSTTPVRGQAATPDWPAVPFVDAGSGCEPSPAPRFPRAAGDPPPPPSPEPTPSPSPSPSPDVSPAGSPQPSPTPVAAVGGFVSGVLTAQAEVTPAQAELSPQPDVTGSPPPAATPSPSPGPVTGIDISHHNGDIDFERVRRAGHSFVFMKATQDVRFLDPRFLDNVAGARGIGMPWGPYHFFDYGVDGTGQADHFLDRVELAGGLDDALPPVIDVECWPPIGSSTHVLAAARLRDFVDRVFVRTGRLPMVYTSVLMWREVVGNALGFDAHHLWAACWGCEAPAIPDGGWSDWTVWQTGLTRIPRVGRLDHNMFNGTLTDLDALVGRRLDLGTPTGWTNDPSLRLDASLLDGTELRISLDGATWSPWRARRASMAVELEPVEGRHQVLVETRLREGIDAPVISEPVGLDMTAPELGPATVVLATGAVDTTDSSDVRYPVELRWTALDALSGLDVPALSAQCDGQRTGATGAATPGAAGEVIGRVAVLGAPPGVECRLTATEHDLAGNRTRSEPVDVRLERIDEEPSGSLVYEGSWELLGDPGALGGQVLSAIGPDATATLTLTAQGVGIVAHRGPQGGRLVVEIDGAEAGRVDLSAEQPSGPEVVFATSLDPEREHVVRLRADVFAAPSPDVPAASPAPVPTQAAPGEAAPGGARVVLDGFIALRSRAGDEPAS
jgi:GH25 family lysozyme M1 (1,4-beta-N-acetylmuramidase)